MSQSSAMARRRYPQLKGSSAPACVCGPRLRQPTEQPEDWATVTRRAQLAPVCL
ncbi:hypothetical protein MHK03_08490 [Corynebacterium simulans]|uniref:hypothetical protein n=1 Tax=Corynebacterium simulans TaxID=146827 RepID=UPI00191266A1|nr:hypothetical protein [Corynebacterium simulans]MCG7247963.1 hypothetical protein [Corynebacterium simulans]